MFWRENIRLVKWLANFEDIKKQEDKYKSFFEAYSITQIIKMCTCLCSVENVLVFLKSTDNIFFYMFG